MAATFLILAALAAGEEVCGGDDAAACNTNLLQTSFEVRTDSADQGRGGGKGKGGKNKFGPPPSLPSSGLVGKTRAAAKDMTACSPVKDTVHLCGTDSAWCIYSQVKEVKLSDGKTNGLNVDCYSFSCGVHGQGYGSVTIHVNPDTGLITWTNDVQYD